MRSSEILRGLADMLDKMSGEESGTSATDEHLAYTANANTENTEKAEKAKDDLGVFLPPLQAKLELLKRAVDVDNIYDEKDAECGDDLVQIKRLSGINPVAISELGDDEPLEG